MSSLTNSIVQTKTVVAISLTTFLTALILTPILLLNILGEDNSKIRIRPEFNIGQFKSECLEEKDALTASIKLPEEKEYKTTDEVTFEGSYNFKCLDEVKNKVEPKITHNWKLNDAEASEDQKGTFGKLPAKEYTAEYTVIIELKGLKTLTAKSARTFKVTEPVVNTPVTNNTPVQNPVTNPTPNPTPVNNAPSASILRPKDGSNYTATQYDRAKNLYSTISFLGSGTDPEDGTLGGASLEWYLISPTGASQLMGTGTNISYNVYAPNCSNAYTVKLIVRDSKGLTAQSVINISVTGYCPPIIF